MRSLRLRNVTTTSYENRTALSRASRRLPRPRPPEYPVMPKVSCGPCYAAAHGGAQRCASIADVHWAQKVGFHPQDLRATVIQEAQQTGHDPVQALPDQCRSRRLPQPSNFIRVDRVAKVGDGRKRHLP